MYSGLIDTINTFIQSLMFVLAADYCVQNKYKRSKIQIFIFVIFISLLMATTTTIMGNSSLSIIIIHVQQLLFFPFLAYKKDRLGSIIGYSIIYLIIGINAIISFMLFILLINNSKIDVTLANILVMYIPQFIISFLVLKNLKFIYKVNLIIKSRVSSIFVLITTTLVADFIISFLFIYNDKDNPLFKEIVFLLLGSFIVLLTLYFANIEKKSIEISRLNKELEKKITELKKIKHDYGSQISYLYGAYLMENYEKLGDLLKGIIAGYDISSQVKILSSESSIISQIVNSTDLKDVDVLIDEKADLESISIGELELQRIISNIIRNSIEAINGSGLLMIKSYYNYNYLVIDIQNNGPKIDDKIIDKIFEKGFSTKENKHGDNGFGLHIVKEIIDNNNGSISVNSNDDLTTFTIKLPYILDN
ncbi:GHKL domain-containing protein [Clostridium sartagoforme]|uniref:histidine kinase n=1 Tax=Clostridium sartagoforme TaxID=84031 RepID=A0A4S2DFJ0_9CLOT|nr:ATP-binding protein [Clostridium sartagoforme]TGY40778.1 GHKL domain-containing protein [Clostridium sartagoforme]